ncbi:MAG TPA: hypothetical protein PKJ51_03560 [Methanothrix sp.]|nr:hypothetical protein [Methanothrix sp.]
MCVNRGGGGGGGKAAEFFKANPDFELIGGAELDSKGNLVIDARRYGSEFGDPSRGGTWYEIPAYPGALSGYEAGKMYSREAGMGVGGREMHSRTITSHNPYYHNWTGQGEAWSVVRVSNKVLGKDETKKLSRGIKGVNAEKAFARVESAVATKLKSQGYDSIVMYDKTGGYIHPKQVFVFK